MQDFMSSPEGGAAAGAASGAAMGTMIMPGIGTAIGAAAGAGASLADSNQKKKKAERGPEEARARHRRLQKISDAVVQAHQQRMMAAAGLSEAAMQWAQMVR